MREGPVGAGHVAEASVVGFRVAADGTDSAAAGDALNLEPGPGCEAGESPGYVGVYRGVVVRDGGFAVAADEGGGVRREGR